MKITINTNEKTRPTDFSWQEGLGCDHAWQLHRTDIAEQVKLAHDELGIKSIRCHGIFDDDMWTISDLNTFSPMPKGSNVRDINFRQCGHAYDNLLKSGVKPFVELSFMPSQLASGKNTGLWYKNNITPPKSWSEWADYIKAFISFLIDRYGKEEVEDWWFEVWNEPDLNGGFFSGTQKDYFKLYEVTAKAIKEIDDKIKVGGPSTSACKWIDEFLSYCKENNVPLDFVSTHHYPGDAFGNLITPANYIGIFKTMIEAVKNRADLTQTLGKMFFDPKKAANVPKDALYKMDDALVKKVGNLPVFMTEWNSMAIFAAPIHDEKYSAAFALKSVLDLNNEFTGYMFWCLSDIFEEQIQLNKPFIGGYGVITNDGIPKPNFWAFKILSQLYGERLDVGFRKNTPVEYAAFKNSKNIQVVVYAQSNNPELNETHEVEIEIDGIFDYVTAQIIDDEHCNPKRMWQKMGEPINLKPSDVEKIKAESSLKEESIDFIADGNKTSIKTTLKTNDIKLFTFYNHTNK